LNPVGELAGREPAETGVWAVGVVIDAPSFDEPPCGWQAPKQAFVEAFVPKTPVQALDEGVLHWLARRNVLISS